MNNFSINEDVRLSTIEALKALPTLFNSPDVLGGVSENALEANLSAIKTAIKKLSDLHMDFSKQELKVIYWSVSYVRNLFSDELDAAESGVDEVAIEDFRYANSVVRFWRNAILSFGGSDIIDVFK